MKPLDFNKEAKKYAHVLNPFGVTCQSVLETRWFQSELAVKYNNFGGIKCRQAWLDRGRTCTAPLLTKEQVGDKLEPFKASFRIFYDLNDYLRCYGEKISTEANYAVAYNGRDCVWQFFAGLYFGGWATDVEYFLKLTNMALKLGPELLEGDWREHLLSSYKTALNRGVLQLWMQRIINKAFGGRNK